jgi:uncharacterized protein
MTTKHIILIISIFIISTINAQTFQDYQGAVNDYENVFSEKQKKVLNKLISKNEIKTESRFIIVSTKKYTPDNNFRTYILGLFQHWKLSSRQSKNGVLILVSLNKKDLKIIPGAKMKTIFTEKLIRHIVENVMTPKFLLQKHFVGLKKGLKSMIKTMKSYHKLKKS